MCNAIRAALSVGAAALLGASALSCHSELTNSSNDPRNPEFQAQRVRQQMRPGALHVGLLIAGAAADSEGAFLAAEQLTEAGGISGRPVHPVLLDAIDYPEGTYEARLQGMVLAGIPVILTSTSSDTLRSFEVAGPAGVLSISSGSTSPQLTAAPRPPDLLFRTCPSDLIQGDVLARIAFDDAAATAGPGVTPTAVILFQGGDPYAEGIRDTFRAGFTSRGGAILREISFTDTNGFDEATINAAIANAFSAPLPHRVVLAAECDPDPAASIAIAWSRAGAPRGLAGSASPWVFPDAIIIPLFIDNLPDNVLGALDGSKGTSLSPGVGPRFQRFRGDFIARFGHEPTSYVSTAYDAIALVGLAAQRAVVNGVADPTGADIANHLRPVANPGGTAAEPGVASLSAALATIRASGDVDYSGAYAAFDFDAIGDVSGEVAYEVFRLDAATRSFTSVETVTRTLP